MCLKSVFLKVLPVYHIVFPILFYYFKIRLVLTLNRRMAININVISVLKMP